MFSSAGCSLLRAEGFFFNFYILYGGQGIAKLYFLSKFFLPAVHFVIKTLDPDWIRIRIK